MNKQHLTVIAALLCASLSFGQTAGASAKPTAPASKAAAPAKPEMKPIPLKAPDMTRKATLMTALSKRASVRAYGDKKLTDQDLSDLLWAANGINRPDKGLRTAPSARNAQDIDVYVITAEGAYLYNAAKNTLDPVEAGDYRSHISPQQAFVATAPVNLVLVSDLSKLTFGADDAAKAMTAAMDAGIVSQNISLFCAAAGLATVPRGMVDESAMKVVLKLKEHQKVLLNHPVGHPK